MPKRAEGEYVLELGNRQLLSIVFIIMVLFGVVFSLGYFMGRSASPEPTVAEPAARPPAPEPTATPPAEKAESAPPPAPAQPPLEPGQAKVAAAPPITTQPAQAPAPQVTPPAKPASAPPATDEPKPAPPIETAQSDEPSAAQPATGQTFLQVAAVKRPEAELIVDVLKKKGFSALVAPGPSDTVFRVLVGPVKDAAGLAKTKADLEAVGFKSTYIRKY